MLDHDADFPHPVPHGGRHPDTGMIWKENWVFPTIDAARRTAALFHVSLRPAHGEGIFTAKFTLDGERHRYVGRSPIPVDVTGMRPVCNDHLRFTVVEPMRRFRIEYTGDGLSADITYTARFDAFDFADGPKPPGTSTLGEIGLSVFPFHHYEQALHAAGTITLGDGTVLPVDGWANRDHSWGWRDDFGFRFHHWICASFDDAYVQGSVMRDTSYDGVKHGGFHSSAAGNVAVASVEPDDAYWLDPPNEPLPPLDRDPTFRITTVDGRTTTVVAHLSGTDYGRLYLNARSPDRAQLYQDEQIFCDYTRLDDGARGTGVLELGKHLAGEGIADRVGRRR